MQRNDTQVVPYNQTKIFVGNGLRAVPFYSALQNLIVFVTGDGFPVPNVFMLIGRQT